MIFNFSQLKMFKSLEGFSTFSSCRCSPGLNFEMCVQGLKHRYRFISAIFLLILQRVFDNDFRYLEGFLMYTANQTTVIPKTQPVQKLVRGFSVAIYDIVFFIIDSFIILFQFRLILNNIWNITFYKIRKFILSNFHDLRTAFKYYRIKSVVNFYAKIGNYDD